jgi:hypothetical protein
MISYTSLREKEEEEEDDKMVQSIITITLIRHLIYTRKKGDGEKP